MSVQPFLLFFVTGKGKVLGICLKDCQQGSPAVVNSQYA